jgi:hypothetical protein
MADIRKRVEEDRGLLKTIQTFVPGFRGYRLKEDLRDSDRMLRAQLAKLLGIQKRGLEQCRKMVKDMTSPQLDRIGGLISQLKQLEGEIAHAETGYSGIAADLRIGTSELNKLYEYDTGIIDNIGSIGGAVESLKASLKASDSSQAETDMDNIQNASVELKDRFERRMQTITGTEV